jgi:hypothetical protein
MNADAEGGTLVVPRVLREGRPPGHRQGETWQGEAAPCFASGDGFSPAPVHLLPWTLKLAV